MSSLFMTAQQLAVYQWLVKIAHAVGPVKSTSLAQVLGQKQAKLILNAFV
jgi:hypothetical protein